MAAPNAPTILSVAQATTQNPDGTSSTLLVFGVAQAKVTGTSPVTSYTLYRSPTGSGGWVAISSALISSVAIVTQLFDQNPVFGVEQFYAATALDHIPAESGRSNHVNYSAALHPVGITPPNLTPDAFGPYPVLGSDLFIDPTIREAVIGPNGDLLTVNGLDCLAQDIRFRILTELGELRLQPKFGFVGGKIIGSGQAQRDVQAQVLRANLIDTLASEPRVYQVLDVTIYQTNADSWLLGFVVMARDAEDPLKLNLVFPYMAA